jgi:outer membrane protein assembly factor BamA
MTGIDTAGNNGRVYLERIIVAGAKKTKEHIILREIQFREGDSLEVASLAREMQLARQQVYNTNLFNEVRFEVAASGPGKITLLVLLRERWYIFPLPVLQLVDRNINEWIKIYDADLSRVIYGIKFTHYNLTGRRDQLRVIGLNGFTRQLSFTYFNPYINKKMTNGVSFGGGLMLNKTFIYKTDTFNRALFFKANDYARTNYFFNANYIIRKNIRHIHSLGLNFNHIEVADSLLKEPYNPNYFIAPSNRVNLIDLSYGYQYMNVNNAAYPLKGNTLSLLLTKRGLGFGGDMDMTVADIWYSHFIALKKDYFFSLQFNGRLAVPFDQPYINRRAQGYGETYLRGLELQVIDGVASALTRLTLKKRFWSARIPFPFGKEKSNGIPISLFAKTYADAGYVYTLEKYRSQLNNKLLYTGGFGVDFLTLYDLSLRVEYSFNQLGQNGLFLHLGFGLQFQR